MRIARLERVRRNERGAAIGAGGPLLLFIEDHDHDHGDVKSARGVVANLNVGVEERHVAEPLAERDALVDDAEHMCARAAAAATTHSAAVVWRALRRSLSHSYSVWKKNQVVGGSYDHQW